MGGRGSNRRKYAAAVLLIIVILSVIDFVRTQNMVQYAYSHFQACLLEYDQSLQEYLDTGDIGSLENAGSAVEHVEHMDEEFLKNSSLSEPLYRKRRTELYNYLRLLSDYTKWLEERVNQGADMEESVRILCDGNHEMEELLVEDSMDYDAIGMKAQKKVLEIISQMTGKIREEMEQAAV